MIAEVSVGSSTIFFRGFRRPLWQQRSEQMERRDREEDQGQSVSRRPLSCTQGPMLPGVEKRTEQMKRENLKQKLPCPGAIQQCLWTYPSTSILWSKGLWCLIRGSMAGGVKLSLRCCYRSHRSQGLHCQFNMVAPFLPWSQSERYWEALSFFDQMKLHLALLEPTMKTSLK